MGRKKDTKDIPAILEVDTQKYVENVENIALKILILQHDNEIYKKIIKAILSIKPEFYNNDLHISLSEVNEICKIGFQSLSKNLKKE